MSAGEDREAFLKAFPVSRETEQRLEIYAATLTKWQAAINLVSESTLDEIWTRHLLDSAQLIEHLPQDGAIADLGAGAGFPGLVVSAITDRPITLVEADSRKCAFLSNAARAMGINKQVTLKNKRVEQLKETQFDCITARAFAPLDRLLTWAQTVSDTSTTFALLKGQSWQQEIEAAERLFDFKVEAIPSRTDEQARLLILNDVTAKDA